MLACMRQIIVFVCTALCSQLTYAEIVDVQTMEQVYQHFAQSWQTTAPKQILGLIDIDTVIFQPGIPALQLPNIIKYRDTLQKMLSTLTCQQRDILLNLLASDTMANLIDPKSPAVIKNIINNHIKTIAITSALTGNLDNIYKFEYWRYQSLQELGIDFAASFPNTHEIVFADVPTYLGRLPLFYNGILFSNGSGDKNYTNTQILLEFIQKIKFHPKKIILVSYNLEEIARIEEVLQGFDKGIQFLGLRYTAAESLASPAVKQADFVKAWERLIEKAKHLAAKL
jgi:hypothetical protein